MAFPRAQYLGRCRSLSIWHLSKMLYVANGLDSMFYADDTQIYIVIDNPKQSVDSVGVL